MTWGIGRSCRPLYLRDPTLYERGRCSQLTAQPDEQRLERQRGRNLQLLRFPPRRTDEFARVFGGVHALERRIRSQLREAVDVHRRRLRARGDDDEIAVPGLELLEQSEQLLALRAPLRASDSLLRLPGGQLETFDLHLGRAFRLRSPFGDAGEERLGTVGRLEGWIGIHRTRNADQRVTPASSGGVEKLESAAEPPTGHARERRHLLLPAPGGIA